ncbi:hypothetical protein [Cellulomonas sp. URHE0023]|uniref:hypothetical protein n=1 Tax=Cellulomonas sp. URHE0023 TaxID=1380354 RepID=UPI00047FBC22|nr:hypothetical protein [Cellulomonas sp. URHE0023]
MSAAVPLLLVLLVGLGVGWALRPVRTEGPQSPSEAWLAAEQHGRRVMTVAWAVLLLVPVLVIVGPFTHGWSQGGVLLGTLPGVAGIAFLLVSGFGELTWPRPVGALRRAPLVRRRLRDLLPRALSILTAVWVGLLAALLLTCGAAGGQDGRSLSYSRTAGTLNRSSPFPGWYYGLPIASTLLVLLLLTGVVLVLVVRRPAVSDTSDEVDLALRRTSLRRVLAGVQLVVAWTLAGCLYIASNAVRGVEPRWADALGPGTSTTVAALCALTAVLIPVAAAVVAVRGSVDKAGPTAARVRATVAV